MKTTSEIESRMVKYAKGYSDNAKAQAPVVKPQPKNSGKKFSRADRTIQKREMKFGSSKHSPEETEKRNDMKKEKKKDARNPR